MEDDMVKYSTDDLKTRIEDIYRNLCVSSFVRECIDLSKLKDLSYTSYSDFSTATRLITKQLQPVVDILNNIQVTSVYNDLSIFELDLIKVSITEADIEKVKKLIVSNIAKKIVELTSGCNMHYSYSNSSVRIAVLNIAVLRSVISKLIRIGIYMSRDTYQRCIDSYYSTLNLIYVDKFNKNFISLCKKASMQEQKYTRGNTVLALLGCNNCCKDLEYAKLLGFSGSRDRGIACYTLVSRRLYESSTFCNDSDIPLGFEFQVLYTLIVRGGYEVRIDCNSSRAISTARIFFSNTETKQKIVKTSGLNELLKYYINDYPTKVLSYNGISLYNKEQESDVKKILARLINK